MRGVPRHVQVVRYRDTADALIAGTAHTSPALAAAAEFLAHARRAPNASRTIDSAVAL